ncbi:MAG: NAD(P)H-dependent oxidoreductase [Ferruginibacter sp.]
MITIISGTNRPQSNTKLVAKEYQRLLAEKGVQAVLLALDEADMCRRDEFFITMEEKYLIPAQKFIIVMPEYNGSYPGILKLMIDLSVVEKAWWHKKVLLTGVSTGRAGNLRGMEHLTGSLLHMKMLVHPNRLPISVVHTLMDEQKHFANTQTLAAVNDQLNEFLAF